MPPRECKEIIDAAIDLPVVTAVSRSLIARVEEEIGSGICPASCSECIVKRSRDGQIDVTQLAGRFMVVAKATSYLMDEVAASSQDS